MLGPARADRQPDQEPARPWAITGRIPPTYPHLMLLSAPRRLVAASPSTIIRIVLPLVLLASVSGATAAAFPLLTAVLHTDTIVAATPAEAATMGLTSGRAVTLTALVDDARRVRSPQGTAAVWYTPVWYAPIMRDSSALLVRTDDPDRLRSRPFTVTGRVTTLGSLGENPKTIALMRDGRGMPVSAQTPVLVERNVIGTALLTALSLLVAWVTAAGSIWLLRWEAAPAPVRSDPEHAAPQVGFGEEALPGA